MADDQNPQLPLDGGTPPGNPSHVPINIEEEMRHSYLAYSMSVIVGRALPDARDGLKPVHRRILTAMDREGLQHNKRYSKCAGVVGECLKKYHPHGDSSVYARHDYRRALKRKASARPEWHQHRDTAAIVAVGVSAEFGRQ